MFRFQYNEYFSLLILLIVLIIVFIIFLKWRRSKLEKLGEQQLISKLVNNKIPGRITSKFVLIGLSILSLIFGLANLQQGAASEKADRKGTDVIFALDVSKSMLANDMPPNRLERAKLLIQTMINKFGGDRVGLVLFAGHAYLQVPLTTDYSTSKMILQTVSPDIVPTQGTVLGDAILMATDAFKNKSKAGKTIVLISDGEDHDSSVKDAVQKAEREGIVIHTVGIGSINGTTILDPITNKNKVDAEGKEVITKLNETVLKEIALDAKGTYQLLQNNNEVADDLIKEIRKQETNNFGNVNFTAFKSYYQYFFLLSLILLIIDWILPAAKKSNKIILNH